MIASARRPRVLVVDDDADSAELYAALLDRRGLEVTIATSYAAALQVARTAEFDVIMTDINLPDGDGCDLFHQVRRIRDVPGIAVTGLSGGDARRRSQEAGFVEHIVKPVDVERVVQIVRRLLGIES
jgi:CheY-like chemotaxis protein